MDMKTADGSSYEYTVAYYVEQVRLGIMSISDVPREYRTDVRIMIREAERHV